MPAQRLQKLLSRAGIASRRKAEELIARGRVTVDGKVVTELGVKVDERQQQVRVDGKLVLAEHFHYVLFHKPRAVMCTTKDPEGRETVIDYMRDVPVRVLPVGRLDYHTSGVLLLSNDGDFVQGLAHAKHHADKVYVAKVKGVVDDAQVARWQQPLVIDGKQTRPAKVKRLRVEGDKTWLEITLTEGRNRQIHRIGEATGNTVLRLARLSFAGITHDGLRPGQWRYLTREELTALKRDHGVPLRVRAPEATPESAANTRAPRRRGNKPAQGARDAARRSETEDTRGRDQGRGDGAGRDGAGRGGKGRGSAGRGSAAVGSAGRVGKRGATRGGKPRFVDRRSGESARKKRKATD